MLKRLICVILCVCFLCSSALAAELTANLSFNGAPLEAGLDDGSDDTAWTVKRGKAFKVNFTAAEAVRSVYVRMAQAPEKVDIRHKVDKRYVSCATLTRPGAEFTAAIPDGLSGDFLMEVTFSAAIAAEVYEIRIFGEGGLSADLHDWRQTGTADILLIAADETAVDAAAIAQWTTAGRSVGILCLTAPAAPLAFQDSLWEAGVRISPVIGTMKALDAAADEKAAKKAWPDKLVNAAVVAAIRAFRPVAVVTAGSGAGYDRIQAVLASAVEGAANYNIETKNAAASGVWVTAGTYGMDEVPALVAAWPGRDEALQRAHAAAEFEGAHFTDPAAIPYPADRLDSGFMPAGSEFVYEDADQGLWAYCSETVQVEIVRYDQPDIVRRWFVTKVKFDPSREALTQVLYPNASFKEQATHPEILAQTAQLVLGINGDYYPYRVNNKSNVGNIIRDRKVIYEFNAGKPTGFPVLDTAALHDDGSMTVYRAGEVTAASLLARGDVHEALSFGPLLVRDSKLCIWNGENWSATEPRCAIGMVEPGSYVILTVEGRFKKGVGPAGINMNQLASLMYTQGVTQAINLDGGNTAVLIFMGKKLNRTASKSGKSETSPRNMMELIGIGRSEKVHTDGVSLK